MHKHGIGGAKDEARAAEFQMKGISKGIEQGDHFCQFVLGNRYLTGEGGVFAKDEAKAVKWLHKDAEGGHKQAKEILSTLTASPI